MADQIVYMKLELHGQAIQERQLPQINSFGRTMVSVCTTRFNIKYSAFYERTRVLIINHHYFPTWHSVGDASWIPCVFCEVWIILTVLLTCSLLLWVCSGIVFRCTAVNVEVLLSSFDGVAAKLYFCVLKLVFGFYARWQSCEKRLLWYLTAWLTQDGFSWNFMLADLLKSPVWGQVWLKLWENICS